MNTKLNFMSTPLGLVILHDIHGKDEHWVNPQHIICIREFKKNGRTNCLEIRTAINITFYFNGTLEKFLKSTKGTFTLYETKEHSISKT
jgi:hypothetical protein